MASTLISRFQHLLKCPGCSLLFNNERIPSKLKCSHNICSDCRDNYIHTLKETNQAELSCPVCQERISHKEILESSVDSFIQTVSSVFGQIENPTSRSECTICKNEASNLFCHDCANILCSTCKEGISNRPLGHLNNKATANVVDSKRIGFTDSLDERCSLPGHRKKVIDCFCVECQELACPTCIAVKHKDHNKQLIKGVAEINRTTLDMEIKRLESANATLQEKITMLASTKKDLKVKTEERMAFIVKQMNDFIIRIKRERDQILKDLKLEIELLNKSMEFCTDKLKLQIRNIKNCIDENKLTLEINNSTMILRKILTSRPLHQRSNVERPVYYDLGFTFATERLNNFSVHEVIGTSVIMEQVNRFSLDFQPRKICLSNNRFVICSNESSFCQMYTMDSRHTATIHLTRFPTYPTDVAICQSGIYITNNSNKLHVYDRDGSFRKTISFPQIISGSGIVLNGEKLYIGCSNNNKIYVANAADVLKQDKMNFVEFQHNGVTAESSFVSFLSASDHLLVVPDNIGHQVHAFKHDGQHVFTYGTGQPGADDGQLHHPWGVCCHNDHIMIADHFNDRLVVLSDKGKRLGYIRIPGMNGPVSMAVGDDGLLRIAHGDEHGPWFISTLHYKIV